MLDDLIREGGQVPAGQRVTASIDSSAQAWTVRLILSDTDVVQVSVADSALRNHTSSRDPLEKSSALLGLATRALLRGGRAGLSRDQLQPALTLLIEYRKAAATTIALRSQP